MTNNDSPGKEAARIQEDWERAVGLGMWITGTVLGAATFLHALENGFTLISAPELPWYELWLPLVVSLLLVVYGTRRMWHP